MVTEQELQALEEEAESLSSQQIPQRRFGSGVTQQTQQQVINQKESARIRLEQLRNIRKSQQVQQQQAQLQQSSPYDEVAELVARSRDRFGIGVRSSRYSQQAKQIFQDAGLSGKEGENLYSSLVRGEGIKQQQQTQLREQGITPIYSNGKLVGYEDAVTRQTIPIESIPSLPTPELTRLQQAGLVELNQSSNQLPTPRELALQQSLQPEERFLNPQSFEVTQERQQNGRLSLLPIQSGNNVGTGLLSGIRNGISTNSNSSNLGVTEDFQKSISGIQKSKDRLIRGQQFLSEKRVTSSSLPIQIGIGLAQTGLNVVSTIRTVTTQNPLKTFTDIIKGSISISKQFLSGEGFPNIGRVLRDEPGYATGRALGEYLTYKIPDVIVSSSDLIRTRGLTKIEAEKIIAPEYFKGQTYPTIEKGQTAGQLLQEFENTPILRKITITKLEGYTGKGSSISISQARQLPVEIPELRPAGFTAAPQPLKGFEVTEGSSELPGLYQAPRLSPQFLKISSEKKLIGLNPFGTLRPSILKIIPKKFVLAKGVTYKTKTLKSINIVRETFETVPRGVSIIPFIKSEKEAIIPVGTILKETNKDFYIKFEGRRVPITEFETLDTPANKRTSRGSPLKEIQSKYSYKVRQAPIVNPYSSAVVLKYNSYFKSSFRSSSSVSNSASYSNILSLSFGSLSKSINSISKVNSISKANSSRNPNSISKSLKSDSYTKLSISKSPPVGSFKYKVSKSSQIRLTSYIGYRPFIISKGKKVYIRSQVLPKGLALRKGETYALKTLRATFGVEPTKIKVAGKDINFNPSDKLFRNYRIRKGVRIPLQDTYIQRLGKRLSFKPEVAELQLARRNKKR